MAAAGLSVRVPVPLFVTVVPPVIDPEKDVVPVWLTVNDPVPPRAIVPVPVRSPVVREAAVLTVAPPAMVMAPSVPPFGKLSVPALTLSGPFTAYVPLTVRIPGPALVSPLLPLRVMPLARD